jgi:hypothetical protein
MCRTCKCPGICYYKCPFCSSLMPSITIIGTHEEYQCEYSQACQLLASARAPEPRSSLLLPCTYLKNKLTTDASTLAPAQPSSDAVIVLAACFAVPYGPTHRQKYEFIPTKQFRTSCLTNSYTPKYHACDEL